MASSEKIARFKCTPAFGCAPVPAITIQLFNKGGRYWVESETAQGKVKSKKLHPVTIDAIGPWLQLLDELCLPARMARPQVLDGEMGTLELFSAGTKLTLQWHSVLPDGAEPHNGFVTWLRQFAAP